MKVRSADIAEPVTRQKSTKLDEEYLNKYIEGKGQKPKVDISDGEMSDIAQEVMEKEMQLMAGGADPDDSSVNMEAGESEFDEQEFGEGFEDEAMENDEGFEEDEEGMEEEQEEEKKKPKGKKR